MLVQIPGERVKVVDEEHVELLAQSGWERRHASRVGVYTLVTVDAKPVTIKESELFASQCANLFLILPRWRRQPFPSRLRFAYKTTAFVFAVNNTIRMRE